MKSQFFLAIKDLLRRKFTSLILLIQVIMVLILINLTVMSFFDLKQMTKEVKRLNQNQEIYSLIDFSDQKHIQALLNNKERLPDLQKLYHHLFHNDSFQTFSLYSSSLLMEDASLRDIENIEQFEEQTSVPFLYVTDLFFQYFNMDISEGSLFTENDYNSKDKTIPAVLGWDFQGKIKVGQTLTDVGGIKYKIIGILKKDMSYIDIMSSRDFQKMDNMMLLPLNENHLITNPDLDAVINKAYIIPKKETQLKKIIEYAAELNTYSFAYKSMREQVKFVIHDKQKWIQMQVFLSTLVMIFTFISFTISFLQFIDKNMYEFGVHFLSGSTKKDLVARIMLQVFPFILIADVISISIAGTLISKGITILISILLGIFVCIIPILKISKLEVSSILRWRNK